MKFNNLEELLINELQELYSAEIQLVEALPKLYEAASTDDLKKAFRNHILETKSQVKRLEDVFNFLDAKAGEIVCHGMKGLIAECDEIIASSASSYIKDAGLIGALQKIQHYEIAAYGTAIAHAKILNKDDIAKMLHTSLEEEATMDKKLTKIAEGSFFSKGVNRQAVKL